MKKCELSNEQKALLEIIKYDLFNKEPLFPAKINWYQLYRELKVQGILGISEKSRDFIVESGIFVPDENNSDTLLDTWKARIEQIKRKHNQVENVQNKLVDILEEHEIPYVILKGLAASTLYPINESRKNGDIDFQVLEEDFDKVNEILLQNGFELTSDEGAKHNVYEYLDTEIELHRRFTRTADENKIEAKAEVYFQNAIHNSDTKSIHGHTFQTLPMFETGLCFLIHMSHHIGVGIGFRHFCDWILYADQFLDDDMWNHSFSKAVEDLNLTKFAKVLTRTGQVYCGLTEEHRSWCLDVPEALCDEFLDYVFLSGNHGLKDIFVYKVTERVSAYKKSKSIFRTLQQRGCANWKALEKHPGLTPFAWLYQVFRYCHNFFKYGNSTGSKADSLKRVKKVEKLRKDLGI